jgi:molybdopterin-guanine dinucleotide biosynthesis protein A
VGDLVLSPIGVILAGGRGRRLGGDKARTELAGRPLISYPLCALIQAVGEVAVVAKPGTLLPLLAGIPIWLEAEEPHHPLVGIIHALRTAGPRPVVVCAADMPFVTAGVLAELARADAQGAPAVIAVQDGRLQPQLGRYEPSALALLEVAAPDRPLRTTVGELGPRLVEVPKSQLFNVNTAGDLAEAEVQLGRLGRP